MQHADAKFERTQPPSLRNVQWAIDDFENTPSIIEVLGWIFLAFFTGVLFVGFLGL